MEKIGILTDTTCDLGLDIQNNSNIKIIPLQIIFNDGRTFRDVYDISYEEAMNSLDNFDAKTSLPSMGDAMKAFDEFIKDGYTHIITMTISHNLSGTHNMVKNISDEYREKLVIENIETCSVAYGLGHVVEEASKQCAQGKSFDEVIEFAKEKFKKSEINFAVETLKYLQKGGRVSKLSGTIGEALDIKPIIHMDKEGKLVPIEKVRGRKKSITKIDAIVRNKAKVEKLETIFIAHGNRIDDANMLKDKMKDIAGDIEIKIVNLGTLVSVHAGPGVLGAGYFWK